jgi:hypothetical protein
MSLIGATGGVIGAAGVAASGSSYLVEENFEGTGAPTGWTTASEGGTINYDSTTSPLRGSQSLRLTHSGWPGARVYKAFTAQSQVYLFARVRWAADAGDDTPILTLRDSSGNTLCTLLVRSGGGAFRLYHGTTFGNASSSPTANTTYYVWISYTAGTGANGAATLHWGTATTKPGSADISVSTGTATADAAQIHCETGEYGGTHDYDQILVSDEAIGDVDS